MLRTFLALVLLAGTAFADAKADLKKDYDNLCNAPERSGANKAKDKQERIQILVRYLQTNIKTDEVKKLLQNLASVRPEDRAAIIKGDAKKAGYTGACPMADEK
jgi:hypothetical protein